MQTTKKRCYPNQYKKWEIDIQNNFRDNLTEKKELPSEQKHLTFEKRKKTESEQIMGDLFQTSTIETNTITTKSAQMVLFSNPSQKTMQYTEAEVEKESNLLFVVMIVAVAVIIALKFLLIPRLKHTRI